VDSAQSFGLRHHPNPVASRGAFGARRLIVVSPHLDDGVMSLGATIARAVRAGTEVEVLTVFGYGPRSSARVGPWDARSGFKTEGEACRVRRREDEEACRILGATHRWLDFGAEPYERQGTPAEIRAAVVAELARADAALIPGFPLVHPDHAELSQLLLGDSLPCRVGLYAEQPYLYWERKRMPPAMRAAALEGTLDSEPQWSRQPADRAERRLKHRAVRCYRSQLKLLGLWYLGLHRLLWHEARHGGEQIAWLE
jgi:LmbE family N-acetylglucosaminyl deacetylase